MEDFLREDARILARFGFDPMAGNSSGSTGSALL
jgi:hypothetical protein